MKAKEICKLRDMLEEANIPYEFTFDIWEFIGNRYQITIKKNGEILCDAILGYRTYGYEEGLLEIMGGLTVEENNYDSVVGYLSADEVFRRFRYCYENNTRVYEVEE